MSLRDTSELSLNGTEVLDETRSLTDLGIVSGDLLHVLDTPSADVSSETTAEDSQPQPDLDDAGERVFPHQALPERESRISSNFSHFQEICDSLCSASSGAPGQELTETGTLCSALHSLMRDSGFIPTEVCVTCLYVYP